MWITQLPSCGHVDCRSGVPTWPVHGAFRGRSLPLSRARLRRRVMDGSRMGLRGGCETSLALFAHRGGHAHCSSVSAPSPKSGEAWIPSSRPAMAPCSPAPPSAPGPDKQLRPNHFQFKLSRTYRGASPAPPLRPVPCQPPGSVRRRAGRLERGLHDSPLAWSGPDSQPTARDLGSLAHAEHAQAAGG